MAADSPPDPQPEPSPETVAEPTADESFGDVDIGEAPGITVAAALVARIGQHVSRLVAKPLAAGLYLVATPIGNLGDITLRALATLSSADVIYCEDTRRSRILLQHFAIERPLRLYHEHNAERSRPEILRALSAGRKLALVSDAGTPLVSDPGFKLVRAAIEAGHPVTSLPGPSAPLAALAVAGLPTDCFLFAGFLPPKQGARRARLAELAAIETTLIVFESGPRLGQTLADLAAVLGNRQAAIARELTKLHEDIVRGELAVLAAASHSTLGEFVIVIGPPSPVDVTDQMIIAALAAEPEGHSVRDCARDVALTLGVTKTRVYALALKTRT